MSVTAKKKKNNFIIIYSVIVIFVITGVIYVTKASRNIVFMDFWRNINNLGEDVVNGSFPWKKIWEAYLGQRNFLQLFLIAFNIKYTNLNCLWESYAGIIVIGISAMCVAHHFIKKSSGSSFFKQITIIPATIMLFNLNQWEILSLEFSFSFMVRILCFIISMMLLDSLLLNENCKLINYILVGCFVGCVVDLMSQLYWIALLCTLFLCCCVMWTQNKILGWKKIIALWGPIISSILIYSYNLGFSQTGLRGNAFWEIFKDNKIFKSFIYMFVGSIIPQSKIEKMDEAKIIIIGIVLIVICILINICFFYLELYEITLFPVMLCLYGVISIPIITVGRLTEFNLRYLTASRYSCETTLIWCGVLIEGAYILMKRKGLFFIPMILILVLFFYSYYTEFNISTYRGYYKDDLKQILLNIDNYSDSDLEQFQATNARLVRDGTRFMQTYGLNIFE